MRTLRIAAMSMVLVVATSLSYAEQTDPVVPTNQTKCSDAQTKLAGAVKDYKGAKFALDRAIQLLGSARYSSRIGKMNLDMASRQADANAATTSYVGSIGPAYGAVALINVSCSDNSIRAPGMRFLKSVDLDVAKFLAGAADKLADDQMADIKKMFDEMKEGRK